jgi:hypothetical protein
MNTTISRPISTEAAHLFRIRIMQEAFRKYNPQDAVRLGVELVIQSFALYILKDIIARARKDNISTDEIELFKSHNLSSHDVRGLTGIDKRLIELVNPSKQMPTRSASKLAKTTTYRVTLTKESSWTDWLDLYFYPQTEEIPSWVAARADGYEFPNPGWLSSSKQSYREMIEELGSAADERISEIETDFEANGLYSDGITESDLELLRPANLIKALRYRAATMIWSIPKSTLAEFAPTIKEDDKRGLMHNHVINAKAARDRDGDIPPQRLYQRIGYTHLEWPPSMRQHIMDFKNNPSKPRLLMLLRLMHLGILNCTESTPIQHGKLSSDIMIEKEIIDMSNSDFKKAQRTANHIITDFPKPMASENSINIWTFPSKNSISKKIVRQWLNSSLSGQSSSSPGQATNDQVLFDIHRFTGLRYLPMAARVEMVMEEYRESDRFMDPEERLECFMQIILDPTEEQAQFQHLGYPNWKHRLPAQLEYPDRLPSLTPQINVSHKEYTDDSGDNSHDQNVSDEESSQQNDSDESSGYLSEELVKQLFKATRPRVKVSNSNSSQVKMYGVLTIYDSRCLTRLHPFLIAFNQIPPHHRPSAT